MRVSGNTVLITGGATGIGLALARELIARDNEVIICGRRDERLERAERAVEGLHIRRADVSTDEGRLELAKWASETFPNLNILVNNAGVQYRVDLCDPRELPKVDEEIATNLIAPIHLGMIFASHLEQRENAAIVNVTSGLAFAPMATMPVYCATKAALHSLTLSLRHQLRHSNVRVFEVAPPLVTSELGSTHRPPTVNEMGMPAEIAAQAIVQAFEHDEYELAIGDAARSREKRESLFSVMNGE